MISMVEKKIYKLNPGYLPKFEYLIKRFAQFGGGASDDKYVQGRSFSNVYEFYIFAFFIGLYRELPMDIGEDEFLMKFWEIENWKPKDLVNQILACAIARSDFDMIAVEDLKEDKSIEAEIRKIKRGIEAYANGGLNYILSEVEADESSAEQDTFFIDMLA